MSPVVMGWSVSGTKDATRPRTPAAHEGGAMNGGDAAHGRVLDDARMAAPVDVLFAQAEIAARRGDCPVAQRIVEQITSRDRSYRVAKGSAVAACLDVGMGSSRR